MSKKISSFATENLQKQHKPKKGKCKFCKKEASICEHDMCMTCGCAKYCWLD